MLHKETLQIKACKVFSYPFLKKNHYANPARILATAPGKIPVAFLFGLCGPETGLRLKPAP